MNFLTQTHEVFDKREKQMAVVRIMTIFIFFVSGGLFGQSFPDHILDALTLRQNGSGLELNMVMGRGVECLGIDVQRSVNGSPFERVYAIGGVCGSPERPEPYGFVDADLTVSGEYTYYIRFGSIGEVQISAIFTAVWESGVSVTPKNGGHTLRVEGMQGAFEVRIFHMNGRLVYSAAGLTDPAVELLSASWQNGVYVLQVESAGRAVTQKFAVYGR